MATLSNLVSPSGLISANSITGINFPDVNTLGIYTNSAERIRITSSGSVGIGTASPSTQLHVVGTTTSNTFSGSGSSLTDLNASNITSGTLSSDRLPAIPSSSLYLAQTFKGF